MSLYWFNQIIVYEKYFRLASFFSIISLFFISSGIAALRVREVGGQVLNCELCVKLTTHNLVPESIRFLV